MSSYFLKIQKYIRSPLPAGLKLYQNYFRTDVLIVGYNNPPAAKINRQPKP